MASSDVDAWAGCADHLHGVVDGDWRRGPGDPGDPLAARNLEVEALALRVDFDDGFAPLWAYQQQRVRAVEANAGVRDGRVGVDVAREERADAARRAVVEDCFFFDVVRDRDRRRRNRRCAGASSSPHRPTPIRRGFPTVRPCRPRRRVGRRRGCQRGGSSPQWWFRRLGSARAVTEMNM